jgi:ELWxxDGT repeat protein
MHRIIQGILLSVLLVWGSALPAAPDSPPPGPARLVHDFFTGEFEGERPLPQITRLGKTLFFVASDVESGTGMWRTDGTAAGTRRIPVPGVSEELGQPRVLGALGDRILWTALTVSNHLVLLSAGETGDAVVLPIGVFGADPRIVGQHLYFLSASGSGFRVWSTDGTVEGTGPVPGLAGRNADFGTLETLAGRWLVFRERHEFLAWNLETSRLLPLLTSGADWVDLHPTGETLFFFVRNQGRLWASRLDSPRAALVFTGDIQIAGWRDGRLYFGTRKGNLWSSDGRREGTRPYTGLQVDPDSFSHLADQLGAVGSTTLLPMPGYYFAALLGVDEERHTVSPVLPTCRGKYPCLGNRMSPVTVAGGKGFEAISGRLARTDGTREGSGYGTGLVKVDPESFGVLGDRLVLGATRQGVEQLWETDGTAAGTRGLTDATRDRPFRVQGPPITYDGALFAAAERKPVGQQLWRVEKTDGRTTPLTSLRHLASGVEPYQAMRVGDRVLLNGAFENWLSVDEDGQVEALPDFYDICWGSLADDPCPFPSLRIGGRVLFFNPYRNGLWSSDGTAAGTVVFPAPDRGILEPVALGRLGDRALVLTRTQELWSSDGTSGGTRFVAALPADPARLHRYPPVGPPVPFGEAAVVFRRAPADAGAKSSLLEAWWTDGTAAGTRFLASTPFPDDYSAWLSPVEVEGRFFFRFGGTFWTSDGTSAGTHPVAEQLPGGTLALAGGAHVLYAVAGYQDSPPHATLWAIDPTTLAASPLGTFNQVGSGFTGRPFGDPIGDALLFGVTDFHTGNETIWVSEGTAAGTRRLEGMPPGVNSDSFFPVGDRRYFTACEAEHGCELWSSGRLGEDRRLEVDLWPGPRSGDPQALWAGDGILLFAGTEPTAGRELWRLDLPASAQLTRAAPGGRRRPRSSPHPPPRRPV